MWIFFPLFEVLCKILFKYTAAECQIEVYLLQHVPIFAWDWPKLVVGIIHGYTRTFRVSKGNFSGVYYTWVHIIIKKLRYQLKSDTNLNVGVNHVFLHVKPRREGWLVYRKKKSYIWKCKFLNLVPSYNKLVEYIGSKMMLEPNLENLFEICNKKPSMY